MTVRFRSRLFLTPSEQEDILDLIDEMDEVDFDTLDEAAKLHNWKTILGYLIFGKPVEGTKETSFPISSAHIELE